MSVTMIRRFVLSQLPDIHEPISLKRARWSKYKISVYIRFGLNAAYDKFHFRPWKFMS